MLENFRAQKIIWDRANKKIFEKIEANSGDSNGRKLVVQIINQEVTESLLGTTLSLGWKSRNGAKGLDAFDVVDASKGVFEIYYTTEMLSNIGNIEASLILIDSTGRIESSTFTISVRPSTVDDKSVESENSFTALTEALVKVNDFNTQLAQKVTHAELDAQLATLLDGGPSIFMDSLTELQSTYPQGAAGVALVRDTDPAKIYVWNGSTWEDFGDYQGIEVKDKTISPEKTTFIKSSNNLFNWKKVKHGYLIDGTTGLEVPNEIYSVSDHIQVKPSQQYTINTIGRYTIYDRDKNRLSSVLIGWSHLPLTITTNPNASTLRLVVPTQSLTHAQLNEGPKLLDYEDWHSRLDEGVRVPRDIEYTNELVELRKVRENGLSNPQLLKNADFTDADTLVTTSTANGLEWRISGGAVSRAGGGAVVFKASNKEGRLSSPDISVETGSVHYIFARFKTTSELVRITNRFEYGSSLGSGAGHSGSGDFEFKSYILRHEGDTLSNPISLVDYREESWDDIEVDFMGAIDITGKEHILTKEYLDSTFKKNGYIAGFNVFSYESLYDEIRKTKEVQGLDVFYIPSGADAYDGTGESGLNAETMSTSDLYSLWDELIDSHPNYLSKTNLGKDSSGLYDLWNVKFKPLSPNVVKKKVLIVANIHGGPNNGGDSIDSALSIYEFIKDIVKSRGNRTALEHMLFNFEINVITCANPWGVNNNKRTNINEIDLNRDFESDTPQSETVIMKNWMSANEDADLFIDIHAYGTTRKTFSVDAYKNSSGTTENEILEDTAEYVSNSIMSATSLHNSSSGMTIYHAKHTRGIPSFLLEFPVYTSNKITHGAEMTTNYVEWVGNVVYRGATQM